MKIKIILITFLFSIFSAAYNTEKIIESLYIVDAGYFGGDDGIDCNTTFKITNIIASRFPDTLEVHYNAFQDYYIHGCQEREIPCKILMRSSDFLPIEESIECEDSWWAN